MKIVFTPVLAPEVAAIGRSLLPAGLTMEDLAPASEPERRAAQLDEADFLMGFFGGSRTIPSDYDHLGNIKLIQVLSAGYDGVDLGRLRQAGVPLANNGGANAHAVAEHTILLILAVYRQLLDLDRLVRAGGWKISQLGHETAHELAGKTVGIVGAGNIGRTLARRLQGFEVELLYTDPVPVPVDLEQALHLTRCGPDDLLGRSDVVTLHAPANESTHHVIGERALSLMKPDALLINCARGELVDAQALAAALRAGRIAGAGIDTFEPEPPNPDNPLLSLSNVVLTPHAAGPTWESWPKRFGYSFANIERVARGEPAKWVVPELREPIASVIAPSRAG